MYLLTWQAKIESCQQETCELLSPIFSENLGLKPPFVSPPLDFPNHRCELRASIARTPLCAILWPLPKYSILTLSRLRFQGLLLGRLIFCHYWLEVTCCFPHLPVVNKLLRFSPSQADWNWLKLIKTDWSWLKLIENDRKSIEMDWKSTRIWRKTIEIAENWLRRFRMEGGVKKHLR